MPDVRMPDGTIIKNVPDNMTPEQRAKFAKFAQAYTVPGFTEASSAAEQEKKKREEYRLGTRERLKSVKSERYSALKEIDSPEKLADAYGYKPEDFNPEDLEKAYSTFISSRPSEQSGAFASFMENFGRTLLAPVAFGKQAVAHIGGDPKSIAAADLYAKMSGEVADVKTGHRPISSTVGALAGGIPMALSLPETAVGAGLGGALMAGATPNTGGGSFLGETALKAGLGGVGGYVGGKLMTGLNTGGTKLAATVRGAIPEENAALQRTITEGLGIPVERVTAADIVTRNGIKTRQSNISKFRDLAQASGGRLNTINEQNLASLDDRLAGIQGRAARDLAETPFAAEGGQYGPLMPGEAIQESLPMEKRIREATVTGPAYAAVPPKPPDSAIQHGGFLAGLEGRVGELEATGAGSPFTSPLTQQGESPARLLRQQLENIKGKQGDPGITPEMVWPPEIQKLITEQGFPEDIFIKQGVRKVPSGPAVAASGGVPGMNTTYGLQQILENLKHGRNKYNAVGGNKLTHPITDTIGELEQTLAPAIGTPEWQAHLSGKSVADDLWREKVAQYNEPLLKGLLRKGGQGGEDVLQSRAMQKAASMNPEELQILGGALEQKGQAGLRSGLIDDLVSSSRNPAMPQGLQVDPKSLLQKLNEWPGRAQLTPEQGQEIGKLQRALELMDQIGAKSSPISASMDVATAPASQRSALKATTEALARLSDRALTSQRGKAMLLTKSAASDPALAGSAIQSFLKYLETRVPGQAIQSGYMTGGIDNPLFGKE